RKRNLIPPLTGQNLTKPRKETSLIFFVCSGFRVFRGWFLIALSEDRDEVGEAEPAALAGPQHASSQQDRQAAEQARQRHGAVDPAVGFEQIGHLMMPARHLAKLQQVDTRDEPDA